MKNRHYLEVILLFRTLRDDEYSREELDRIVPLAGWSKETIDQLEKSFVSPLGSL